ncbi:MAG TPA: hypothetical protein VFR37_21080 [Longimicrobium sp.]|nr:hypothetical protein [Longimicrobium sp.]
MVLITTRALGRRRPLLDDWSVDLPPDQGDGGDGGLTLGELIARVVRAEVAAFRRREREGALLRVLSEAEIQAGAARGRVAPGGRPAPGDAAAIDEDDAVAVALTGFQDGLYLVLVDGTEQRDLDAQVYLRPDTRLTFLRLTFLAGA